MSESPPDASSPPLNWTSIVSLYAALALGFAGMMYWGHYRNAAWLALLGIAGGLTAYGRMREEQGAVQEARRWKQAAGLLYGVFFLWAGAVLLQLLLR
jgi:hypothetical protein